MAQDASINHLIHNEASTSNLRHCCIISMFTRQNPTFMHHYSICKLNLFAPYLVPIIVYSRPYCCHRLFIWSVSLVLINQKRENNTGWGTMLHVYHTPAIIAL